MATPLPSKRCQFGVNLRLKHLINLSVLGLVQLETKAPALREPGERAQKLSFTGEPARGLLLELRERLPEGCRLVIGGKGAARLRQVPGIRKTKELCVG